MSKRFRRRLTPRAMVEPDHGAARGRCYTTSPAVYEDFFGFHEKPFNITPNPRYLYLSTQHQEALAHLQYAHRERGGFVLVSGEVGTGKTTVARHFLAGLGPDTSVAVVLFPVLSASELLKTILDDLRVPVPEGSSLKVLVDHLHEFLLATRAENRNVVVVIDEAQDLSEQVLEQVRLISNLETDTEKLLQIVLIGQSEIDELLSRPRLRQINQRITTRFHLDALDQRASGAYVYHRLKVAGGEGRVIFTPKALRAIYRHSRGIPRVINLLCDRALLGGYANGTRWVDRDLIDKAAREVLPRAARQRRVLAWTTAALVLAVGIVGATVWRPIWLRSQAPTDPPPIASPTPTTHEPPQPSSASALREQVLRLDRATSYADAVNATRSLWRSSSPDTVTSLRTTLAQIRRFDLPVVLEVVHTSAPAPTFIALLGLNDGQAVVGIGTVRLPVGVSEIEALWTRQAYFPWPGPGPHDARKDWTTRAFHVAGIDDDDPKSATVAFQRRVELVPDGALGPHTLLALYALTVLDRPRLRAATAP